MYSMLFVKSGIDFLAPVADVLGWVLNLLYEFLGIFGIHNTGITIILFTFIIYTFMVPLTLKQQKFQKLQSTMAPELTKITAKYKGKKDEASIRKQQAETQAVYSRFGASPTGGCMTMIITLPIMFALYKVIQHIPAYVNDISALYDPIAKGIQGVTGYDTIMGNENYATMAKTLKVGVNQWSGSTTQVVNTNLIDLLSQFKTADWNNLTKDFSTNASLQTTIKSSLVEIKNVNSFIGGLNILEQPGMKLPGILIPILAAALQFVQTKMMSLNSTIDPNSPTASSMKAMNTVMPLMSGAFCIILPIGVGLYWIAGSMFRIVQQFFVNKYMDSMDMDAFIQKNVEKSNKKKARRGIDPYVSVEQISKTRTSSIQDNSTKSIANRKVNTEASNYKKSEVSYKAGSIAANANLLSRKNSDKGEN